MHGFDLVPALKEAAEGKCTKVFDSGAAAVADVDVDVVITSPPNGAIVKACYADVLKRGFAQLDAPVSGGVKGATAGTLAFMVGGDEPAVEQARPVLEPLAGKIITAVDPAPARLPNCVTTWCLRCRSRLARLSSWPRSWVCPPSRYSM